MILEIGGQSHESNFRKRILRARPRTEDLFDRGAEELQTTFMFNHDLREIYLDTLQIGQSNDSDTVPGHWRAF